MKYLNVILLCFALSGWLFGQSKFDIALSEVSNDLVTKLGQKNKKTLVVLYITDINKSTTIAGKYLADVISVNIVNEPGNFQVFDRENLNSISEAKKLIAEGYIDVDATKQLGRLLSVEVIVVGNYTVLSETLKLTLKALDSGTGFVVAASIKDLPIDGDAGALLGVSAGNSNSSFNENNSNRGFNTPLNSNEQYNNPETVNHECEVKNFGDYCFENNTQKKMGIFFDNGPDSDDFSARQVIIAPGETQCFYRIDAVDCIYVIYKGVTYSSGKEYYFDGGNIYSRGNVLIEKCKSKTFIIK